MVDTINISAEASDKPKFGTIRKAIQATANQLAAKEFLDDSKQRHIDYVISMFKMMQRTNPKGLSNLIVFAAKGKDIKDELGSELNGIFQDVWDEKTKNFGEVADAALDILTKTGELLSLDQNDTSFVDFIKRYFDAKIDELKKDPRIISAFAGKEELLDKIVDFSIGLVGFAQDLAKAYR